MTPTKRLSKPLETRFINVYGRAVCAFMTIPG